MLKKHGSWTKWNNKKEIKKNAISILENEKRWIKVKMNMVFMNVRIIIYNRNNSH